MFDLKVNKVFKNDKLEDMYVVSIMLDDDRYYNLTLSKKEFNKVSDRMKSIKENNEL
jgi:hypothetical protein